MACHWLPLLFSLNLMILMTADAAIPPQVYWERMLPNAPMPKPIIDLLTLGIKSHDEIPFQRYGKGIESQDEFPIIYGKGIESQDEFLRVYGKGIESQDEFPIIYGKGIKSHNEKSVIKMIPVANHHQHDNPKPNMFFTEEGLRPGAIIDAFFYKRNYTTSLLPREFAERIPFSSKMIKEILEILSLKPESKNVENVVNTISVCDAPAVNGQEKHCATSIESMVDFVTSKLEKNIHVISTEVEKETDSTKLSVKDGIKMLTEDKVIVCHPMNYPYVVFYCHEILNTIAYFMPLEGEDGTRVKAPAICHQDTSEWNPNHISFKMLKMKPGTGPVCHVIPVGHLVWFAK